jgi:hypothetical protein
MAMNKELVPTKEARQSIFGRLRSRPNPLSHSQKMKEVQMEINSLRAKNDFSSKYSFFSFFLSLPLTLFSSILTPKYGISLELYEKSEIFSKDICRSF